MILVKEAAAFLKSNPESSLVLIEFCIFDDLTAGYFEKEFNSL